VPLQLATYRPALEWGNALRAAAVGIAAKLTVGDYDKRLKVLKVGQDKAGKDRRIKMPDVTATFFEDACKGKLPSAPLLSRADGKEWNKDAWKGPVKDAVLRAKLPEAE
jgi:hypothetical protein